MTKTGHDMLRAPTYTENLALDSYKTAVESSIADASSFGDKVVTAAVSVATAYGAVIALVAPKDEPSTLAVIGPFFAFAVAVGFALGAQGVSIAIPEGNALDKIESTVKSTVSNKRLLGNVGLGALLIGLVWAGIVLQASYGKPADTSKAATIWLTATGKRLVGTTCGASGVTLVGKVTDASSFGGKSISVKVDRTACAKGAGTLVLPPSAVAAALLTG